MPITADRNADIRRAREKLAVARYYEDREAERVALDRLAALGADEAGDDVVPNEDGSTS